ncbi:hypothetical protein GQ44DRAFT_727902 [Phaeosphaeriaceae sp. PMI808]|nr:hypothetical protein GQ44DRAFT_727902 [Phaeosphaeriaceae sp. PMI808]
MPLRLDDDGDNDILDFGKRVRIKANEATHDFRSHAAAEMRNFICGNIKRNDPPPKDERWVFQEQKSSGRASRDEYHTLVEIRPPFFEQIVEQVLTRALRVTEVADMFSATRHIMQTITREPLTGRVRSIKPDEQVPSLWEGDNLFRLDPSAVERAEKEPFDVRRFISDLDTDEEPMNSEVELAPDDKYFLDDDETSYSASEYAVTCETVNIMANRMRASGMRKPDYFLPVLRCLLIVTGIPKSVKEDPVSLMSCVRTALRRQKIASTTDAEVEADFYRFLDRKKSKVFKK